MSKNSELKNLLYSSKIKVILSMIFCFSMYSFIILSFSKNVLVGIYLVQIIMFVTNLCVILVTWSTRRLDRSKLFDLVSYVFIVVIFSNLVVYMLDLTEIMRKNDNIIFLKEYGIYLLILYAEAIRAVFAFINTKRIILENHLIRIIVLFGIILILYNLDMNRVSVVIGVLYFIQTAVANINDISKFDLVIEDEINYFYVFAIINLIVSILMLIMLIFYVPNDFSRVLNALIFTELNVLAIFTVDNLLNNPYKILFAKVYSKSEELKNINKDYLEKIREHEFTRLRLKNSEKLVKDLLRSMPVPLVIINNETKRIIYANKLFLNLVREDNLRSIVNFNINYIIDIENGDVFDDDSKLKISKCKIRNSESFLTMQLVNTNIENGEIILSFTDITSKEKLNKIKDEIKENEFRQKIRKNFLSNISHDLKTPINVIYSATQLESFFVQNNDINSLIKYIDISKSNCSSLISLADNIIDVGKINSDDIDVNLEKIEVVEFIEEIVQSLVFYAKSKNIDLIFDTNEEIIYLYLDKKAINRIIVNIISNSIKFTEQGGEVLVKITNNLLGVNIEIIDNGIGIDEDLIKNIFDMYSTKGKGKSLMEKGSGIGLYVVKRLVEAQGGEVTIESKKLCGTKVGLFFKRGGLKNN
ncbi:MAG: sensor histidine kinase [Clostridium sp.]|uniref:sensor histidine kinase n=1 Tax=Clostridium sp. LY3-2 TaxID=2942482 RepID=UPI0021531188|nr:HAMP domain-containing sensor histidine kinase [Clostridium sp. LY3-2]MCR6515106.1 HAMP domain-containing histidine kinase [Clostridium sp. LY3-2]